jgi:RNA polymerase sigma-70 factor (ECF subfamily)
MSPIGLLPARHTVPVRTSGRTSGAAGDAAAGTRVPDLVAVVKAVAGGDKAAFAYLYDTLSPMVHGTAWRVLRDPELAAEVTQEVMLEIWRDSARYLPERGTVHAWAATTAHRRAVDRVRSVQAQRNRDELDAVESHRTPYDDVAEEVERRAERDQVHECLDTLTDVQRQVVVMAYFGGRTYREVADELGAALPTVKSRIRDGLTRLRTCLGVE